ncbi:serine hydrolase domain-containing protein [Thermoactinospora rubra]|uniref:serine hydrolase domain-containing protein n=1 Tax=Thermoactinospora rubra TaxID=1088767 RepID=UPI000A11A73A|nr:serine hydrolase domain-containing protein [Thermoactinospora rubra]
MNGSRPSRRSALRLLGIAPLAAGGLPTASGTAHANRIPKDARPGGAYDRFLAKLAAEDGFSGTVLLAHRGRTVLARAYGMADKEKKIPNTIDTIYNLASAAKPFTALAIVQLAQQRKLGFHEKLGTYLDGLPADIAETVTVHHLLTHTGGMGDPTRPGDQAPSQKVFMSAEEQLADLRKRIREQRLEFTPGARHAYSSMGMEVLGEVVAKVSGQTFWDYVHENVFVPARMTRSGYFTRPQWLSDERIAHPYMYQSDGSRVDAVRNLDKGAVLGGAPGSNAARQWVGYGGGGGFSTAPDLVRFALALRGGKLLGHAYTELFQSGKVPVPPRRGAGTSDPAVQEAFQAYGVTAPVVGGQRLIGHGGGIGGGNTNWSIYLDSDWVGVILCNYDLDIQPIIARERQAVIGS